MVKFRRELKIPLGNIINKISSGVNLALNRVIQVTKRTCGLCKAGGKSFNFAVPVVREASVAL